MITYFPANNFIVLLIIYFSLFIVDFLAVLYEFYLKTYTSKEVQKIKMVQVKKRSFTKKPEAQHIFDVMHDDWEMNICLKFHIGGKFVFH
jgi:exopolysaccharide biosynthesis protein